MLYAIDHSLVEKLSRSFGIVRDKQVIKRAKNKILEYIVGKHEECYEQLSKYTKVLKMANSGSITYIRWDDPFEGRDETSFQENVLVLQCLQGSSLTWMQDDHNG